MKVDLAENQVQISTLEKENSNLRRDKEILTDHVADLQKQVILNLMLELQCLTLNYIIMYNYKVF